MLRPFPSSTRAAAITPAEPVGARVARFPTAVSLPRLPAGSASASFVSRPARRSLALQPAWSLNRPRRPFVIGVLQPMSLPPSSAPTATGWSDSCRAGFAPAEEWRLVTAHRKPSVRVICPVLIFPPPWGKRTSKPETASAEYQSPPQLSDHTTTGYRHLTSPPLPTFRRLRPIV